MTGELPCSMGLVLSDLRCWTDTREPGSEAQGVQESKADLSRQSGGMILPARDLGMLTLPAKFFKPLRSRAKTGIDGERCIEPNALHYVILCHIVASRNKYLVLFALESDLTTSWLSRLGKGETASPVTPYPQHTSSSYGSLALQVEGHITWLVLYCVWSVIALFSCVATSRLGPLRTHLVGVCLRGAQHIQICVLYLMHSSAQTTVAWPYV